MDFALDLELYPEIMSDANTFPGRKLRPGVQGRRECGDHSDTGETIQTLHIRHFQKYCGSRRRAVGVSPMFTCHRLWGRC